MKQGRDSKGGPGISPDNRPLRLFTMPYSETLSRKKTYTSDMIISDNKSRLQSPLIFPANGPVLSCPI